MLLLFCRFLHWLHTLQLHNFYKSRQDQPASDTHTTEADTQTTQVDCHTDTHTTKVDTHTTKVDTHTTKVDTEAVVKGASTKDLTDVSTIAVTDSESKI